MRCIIGDCLSILPTLESGSAQMCVTSPPDRRFRKGAHASPATEFKAGQHWRPHKPHWDKAWLLREYMTNGRAAADIARQAGCTENNILYWLGKHEIPTRDMATIRKAKYWGAVGNANPMCGKTGALNPRYVDGSSPERQRFYVRSIGRAFIQSVYARDGFKCVRCGISKHGPKSLHAHHIKPWAGNPELRFDESNAVTLCRPCHWWVHSKKNIAGEFIGV